MSDIKTKNATISYAALGIGERGFLEFDIRLNYGDSCSQGFGGYVLAWPDQEGGTDFAAMYICRVLRVAGVRWIHELVGRNIRVEASYEKVYRIGHITKNIWFDPKELK